MKRHVKRTLLLFTVTLLVLSVSPPLYRLVSLTLWRIREKVHYDRAYEANMRVLLMDSAFKELLADLDVPSLYQVFSDTDALCKDYGSLQAAWNTIIPDLLEHGRDSNVDLPADLLKRLRPSYVRIGPDPWGQPYHFFAGPLPEGDRQTEATTKGAATNPEGGVQSAYSVRLDLPLYVWSFGRDGRSSQRVQSGLTRQNVPVGTEGDSGDDINNWDGQRSWERYYLRTG